MSKKIQYRVVATLWAKGQAVLPGELYTPATAAEAKRLLKAGALAEVPSPATQTDPPPPPPPPPENDPAPATTETGEPGEPGEPDQDQSDADTSADADQDSAPGLDLEPAAGEPEAKADAKA